jgi:hypothetical protein
MIIVDLASQSESAQEQAWVTGYPDTQFPISRDETVSLKHSLIMVIIYLTDHQAANRAPNTSVLLIIA